MPQLPLPDFMLLFLLQITEQGSSARAWALGGIAALVLYAAAMATWVAFDTPSIAYVDSAVLMERFDGAIQARATLESQLEEWDANVRTLETEAQALQQRLVDAQTAGRSFRVLQDSLTAKQRDLARYVRATQAQAAEKEQELLEPVYAELNALIQDFSDANGYDLLFGTVAGGNILYGTGSVDATEALIAYVNNPAQQ